MVVKRVFDLMDRDRDGAGLRLRLRVRVRDGDRDGAGLRVRVRVRVRDSDRDGAGLRVRVRDGDRDGAGLRVRVRVRVKDGDRDGVGSLEDLALALALTLTPEPQAHAGVICFDDFARGIFPLASAQASLDDKLTLTLTLTLSLSLTLTLTLSHPDPDPDPDPGPSPHPNPCPNARACMRRSAAYERLPTFRWPSASRTLSETCEGGAHTCASARVAPLARAPARVLAAAAHRGVLPRPLKLERANLATEAVHEGDHLPGPVLARVPGATEDLAIVLPHAACGVDREADVGRAAGAEALEEVAAARPGLLFGLRALGSPVCGARRCAAFRPRHGGPAAARHLGEPL